MTTLAVVTGGAGFVPGEHPEPVHAPPRAGEVRDSWSDISAAREAMGYEPKIAFEEGLRRTIDWVAADDRSKGLGDPPASLPEVR